MESFIFNPLTYYYSASIVSTSPQHYLTQPLSRPLSPPVNEIQPYSFYYSFSAQLSGTYFFVLPLQPFALAMPSYSNN